MGGMPTPPLRPAARAELLTGQLFMLRAAVGRYEERVRRAVVVCLIRDEDPPYRLLAATRRLRRVRQYVDQLPRRLGLVETPVSLPSSLLPSSSWLRALTPRTVLTDHRRLAWELRCVSPVKHPCRVCVPLLICPSSRSQLTSAIDYLDLDALGRLDLADSDDDDDDDAADAADERGTVPEFLRAPPLLHDEVRVAPVHTNSSESCLPRRTTTQTAARPLRRS